MIEIPVHDRAGKQVGSVEVDEALLGSEIRPALLKQAYVRYHANARQGTVRTKSRADLPHSGKKLYRQKGTGNARRGDRKANILRGGGHTFAKRPKSWRQGMPIKMRRLATRNALLAKAVDHEIKLVDSLEFDKPSTKQFQALLEALKVDRSCVLALSDTRDHAGRSARNIDDLTLTQIDQLNAYELLSHRYIIAEKQAFEQYLARLAEQAKTRGADAAKEVA